MTVAAARDGGRVLVRGERAVGHDRARALGRLLRASGIARADRDRHAGPREPHRKAEAERARGADDRDRVWSRGCHGGRV